MTFLSPAWLLLLVPVPALVFLTLREMRRKGGRMTAARRRAFLALRTAAVVLLAFGLAGLVLSRLSDRLSVVFLLDESRSVGEEQRGRALQVVEAVRARLHRGDAASLVRFGANAEQEELLPGTPVSAEGGDGLDTGATDIGGAIQLALAQASRAAPPRIVLLSDGNENRGSAAQAAAVAKAFGARIFPVALPGPEAAAGGTGGGAAREVSIEDIRAPERVRQGEAHEVTVMLRSSGDTPARVTLFRDGQPVAKREASLAAGENTVQFSGVLPQRGLHAWDALVEAPGDGTAQNNHYRRLVEVTGTPQVLYASRPGHDSPAFVSALQSQGIDVVRSPSVAALPGTLAGYLPYDALILDDVPGFGISTEKMETIARYVRDAGGGLLMAGGDASFGAGGYYKTPIERVLPVDMDVKSQVQIPRLSLVIVVDKSGSMGATVPTGETKLDVVKSAALSSIELLNPFDKVGLLAFDADWEWTVPLTEAGDTQKISSQLAGLQPGGGTIMYPALEEAARVISASPSPLRHVIVLTDGLTNPGEFQKLVRGMARRHITVSTVAVGEDADRGLLEDIAKWGGGRTYATHDPRDVPRIFMTETTLVTRGLLVEKSFLPRQVSAGESVRGIPMDTMPGLGGFVLTYMKPGAEMVLSALYDAPLLASWRYGLGRTAAYTSDLRGRWGKGLLSWDQFPRFVSQLVRWLERPTGADILHPGVEAAAGTASLQVDAWEPLGAFVDGLAIDGVVLGPDGERTEIKVPQTAPGLYEAQFPAAKVGDYTVTLAASSGEAALPPLTVGVAVPYSDEYRMLGVNAPLLAQLAGITGGRAVSSADDEAAIAEIVKREPARAAGGVQPWRLLLLSAVLLFFLDVVVRKVALPQGWFARAASSFRLPGKRPGITYDELTGMVEKARDEERARLKKKITGAAGQESIDPELAAYLYIARLRSRKASEEKKG
jgi:Ca-activated chloride channel homolog